MCVINYEPNKKWEKKRREEKKKTLQLGDAKEEKKIKEKKRKAEVIMNFISKFF